MPEAEGQLDIFKRAYEEARQDSITVRTANTKLRAQLATMRGVLAWGLENNIQHQDDEPCHCVRVDIERGEVVTTVDWSRVERARRLAELEAEVLRCAVELLWFDKREYIIKAKLGTPAGNAVGMFRDAVAAYVAERGAEWPENTGDRF
jgi:hypothetical protein